MNAVTDPAVTGTIYKLEPLKDRVRHLMTLCMSARLASTEFAEAVKDTAEKTKLDAPVIRAYIMARTSEQLHKKQSAAEQLSLLFGSNIE